MGNCYSQPTSQKLLDLNDSIEVNIVTYTIYDLQYGCDELCMDGSKPHFRKAHYRNYISDPQRHINSKKVNFNFTFEYLYQHLNFDIYINVLFDQKIITVRKIISDEFTTPNIHLTNQFELITQSYAKLVINRTNGDVWLMNEMGTVIYLLLNNKADLICSQWIHYPSFDRLYKLNYTLIIDYINQSYDNSRYIDDKDKLYKQDLLSYGQFISI